MEELKFSMILFKDDYKTVSDRLFDLEITEKVYEFASDEGIEVDSMIYVHDTEGEEYSTLVELVSTESQEDVDHLASIIHDVLTNDGIK